MNVDLSLIGFTIHLRNLSRALAVLVYIAWAVLALWLVPSAGIWVLDTLFPALAIPYGFYQWLAMFLLMNYLGRLGKTSE